MKIIVILLSLLILMGCGKISQPPESVIEIKDDYILTLNIEDVDLIQKYLSGNSRWEVRKNKMGFYAIRREMVDGNYKTTINGFYSNHIKDGLTQTRVIISFGKPYGFGSDRGNITKVTVKKNLKIKTIIEEPHSGTPGYSSYVILIGNGINLEVYDQSPEMSRDFTGLAFDSINHEIKTALQYRDDIRKSGRIPLPELYQDKVVSNEILAVNDGMQPGIFLVEAWVNPFESGELYLKVFNTSTGKRLSEDKITSNSTRLVSWNDDPKTLFPYNSVITVYEGDWDHEYEADFELWHTNSKGKEKKLLEITRIINGWQR